jgi:uncharacterized repeat protein (TIGR03837 family)
VNAPSSCDIFCAVVDNYGDIGVCWRLARQLAGEYGITVRIWVDDLAALQHIWPAASATEAMQRCAGVEVHRWSAALPEVEPATLVVEAFACELPAGYVRAMGRAARQPVWINLEYLSAEDWVVDCHGLPSPQPEGAPLKYFFFPGFVAGTGGLLRERDLLQRRETFQGSPEARAEFLSACAGDGLPPGLLVSLFAYENEALPPLLQAWSESDQPVVCLVPEGRPLAAVGQFFGASAAAPGQRWRRGALTVAALPFLAQDDYDRLLWSCDLNFVRGEDSFVRAQWAARPCVWHIYPQAEDAHWPKLDAFLGLYREVRPEAGHAMATFWRAWNGRGAIGPAWRDFAAALPLLRAAAEDWSAGLARRGNLAAALVQFCANHV